MTIIYSLLKISFFDKQTRYEWRCKKALLKIRLTLNVVCFEIKEMAEKTDVLILILATKLPQKNTLEHLVLSTFRYISINIKNNKIIKILTH